MITLRVSEALEEIGATWSKVPTPTLRIRSISTDTRHLERGSLFVGVVGEQFDGSQFAAEAVHRGAIAVICEDSPVARETLAELEASTKTAVAVVPNARVALGELAKLVRARLEGVVIGITGSCGKTSTKAVLAELLAAEHDVISSPASFNNDIGVPRTIFLADERTEALVVEIGTNGPGEIAQLSAIAKPRVALVTNVGRSHLEGLGSVEGVAREKGELIAGLSGVPDAIAVLNLDCPRTPHLLRRVPAAARLVTVSASGDPRASLRAEDVRMGPDGMRFRLGGELSGSAGTGEEIFVSLLGRHAVANVLMAAATLRALEVPLEGCIERLGRLQPEPHRMAPMQRAGVHVIDDTYNANPESVASAVRVLAEVGLPNAVPDAALSVNSGLNSGANSDRRADENGRRVLILGPMGELGADSEMLHRAAGADAQEAGLTEFVLVGVDLSGPEELDQNLHAGLLAFAEGATGAGLRSAHGSLDGQTFSHGGVRVHFAPTTEHAVGLLAAGPLALSPGDVVLCKASRAAKLERLVDSLSELLEARSSVARPEDPAPKGKVVHS